mgnify:CR=1 FL=1
MNHNTLTVLGAGTMGHGIAQVSAVAGHRVVVCEEEQEALDRGMGRIRKSLDKLVEKEKVSAEDAQAALGRRSPATRSSWDSSGWDGSA